LVPYDGSRTSQAALGAAFRIAEGKGAKLKGLFVQDERIIAGHRVEDFVGSTGAAPYAGLEQQSRKAFARIGKALLGAFEKQCAAKNVPCELQMAEDYVADAIVSAARKS